MIGVLILTHGNLGSFFLQAAEVILGPQRFVHCIPFLISDDLEKKQSDVRQILQSMNTSSGVLLLTDLFGGTPSNIAMSVLDHGKIEVLSGINLPALLYIFQNRHNVPLIDLAKDAEESGRRYLCRAGHFLSEPL